MSTIVPSAHEKQVTSGSQLHCHVHSHVHSQRPPACYIRNSIPRPSSLSSSSFALRGQVIVEWYLLVDIIVSFFYGISGITGRLS